MALTDVIQARSCLLEFVCELLLLIKVLVFVDSGSTIRTRFTP